MPLVALVLLGIAALLHVGFFVMESLLWRRPAVYRRFGVNDPDEAAIMAPALFNQGFYNLFLAVGAIVGIALSSTVLVRRHNDLFVYTALFMVGAAVVLYATDRRRLPGALLQGLPPLLALLSAALF
jgi:putative membrane protein